MDPQVAAQPATAKGEVTATDPTRVQQAAARRVAEAAATIPAASVEARLEAAPSVGAAAGAFARALAEHRRANGAWRDGRFESYSRVNVALVVDAGDGLVAPVLFDADRKDAAALDREAAELAAAARDGGLTSPQMAGATTTLWAVPGVDRATPPVTPGQAVALAVALGSGGGAGLTLASDQRIVALPAAAALLSRVRELLESPA